VLVLSRKVGQRLLIGDQVTVTIVKVGRSGVRVGVEAPPETPIMREELAKAIADESFSALVTRRGDFEI
jgi:carbon storage regulator